jgi:hypothetical protein
MEKIESQVSIIVNNGRKDRITDGKLSWLLRKHVQESRYKDHVQAFFVQVPVHVQETFLHQNEISLQQFLEYYRDFIRSDVKDKELEELLHAFNVVQGTTDTPSKQEQR